MDWIIENKEWLFGGVAIALPLAFIGWFISRTKNKQTQRGGKDSTNIQVGGSININREKEND